MRKRWQSCVGAIAGTMVLLACGRGASGSAPRYSAWQPGLLIASYGTVSGMNDLGEACYTSDFNWGTPIPYVWDGLQNIPLSTVPSGAVPCAINNAGRVVGYQSGYYTKAVVWDGGTAQVLGTLGGNNSRAMAVNSSGLVAGDSEVAGGGKHLFTWDGTMHDQGTAPGVYYQQVAAMNDLGQIVGTQGGLGGWVWQDGVFTPLPDLDGGAHGSPTDINNHGLVVGSVIVGSHPCAVTWAGAQPVLLPVPEGTSDSEALSVNDQGLIVGYCVTPQNIYGCLWADGACYVLEDILDSPCRISRAWVMNNEGEIMVMGKRNGWTAFLLTPIPEPATLALLAAGGVGMLRRRRGPECVEGRHPESIEGRK